MQKNQKKIVLIGAPSSGKTSVLQELKKRGFYCFDEISREVTLKAKEEGIDQLFLEDPLLFSKLLLEGREQQYLKAEKSNKNLVFFDRGIPDIIAYLDCFKTPIPQLFEEKCHQYQYQKIFHFSPWKKIHITDNERYESFEEALQIDAFLTKTYQKFGYQIVDVPFGSIDERVNYIIHYLQSDV